MPCATMFICIQVFDGRSIPARTTVKLWVEEGSRGKTSGQSSVVPFDNADTAIIQKRV